MVEPITVMIIGCIISGVGILLAAAGTFVSIYSSYKLQKMSESQKKKYNKAKQKIMNKYSFASTPDEYIKLACTLHLLKSEAKQCSHLNIDTNVGNVTLMVSLHDVLLKYKPFKTWYTCKCHFDENDKSIWTTFLDTKSRDRLQGYLNNNIRIDDIIAKCKELNQNMDEDCSESDSGELSLEDESHTENNNNNNNNNNKKQSTLRKRTSTKNDLDIPIVDSREYLKDGDDIVSRREKKSSKQNNETLETYFW